MCVKQVSSNPYKSPLAEAFIQGGREIGYKNRDGNGEYHAGELLLHFFLLHALI